MRKNIILIAIIVTLIFIIPIIVTPIKSISDKGKAIKEARKIASLYCVDRESKEVKDFIRGNHELFMSAMIDIVNDKNSDLSQKIMAIMTLSAAKEKRAIETFLKCLQSNSSELRGYAAIGLGDIGDEKNARDLSRAWISETIGNKWDNTGCSVSTKRHIAVALSKIGNKEAIPFLMETYNNTKNEIKGLSAVALFGILNEDVYLNALKEMLQDTNNFRRTIILSLGEICNEKNKTIIIPLLKECAENGDAEIKKASRLALKIAIFNPEFSSNSEVILDE